jgi:hypothetical protein
MDQAINQKPKTITVTITKLFHKPNSGRDRKINQTEKNRLFIPNNNPRPK